MKRGYILPIIILFAIIAVLALPSLLKDDEDEMSVDMSLESVDYSFEKDAVYKCQTFFCDSGAIGINNGTLTYTSFKEKASIVLCNILDCAHESADCPAWLGDENVFAIYYYNDKQYILSSSQDGMFSKLHLYEAETDGTGRHVIHKFEYYDGNDFFCIDNMMYMFVQEKRRSTEADSLGNVHEIPQTTRLIAYNLDTGEIKDKILHEQLYQLGYFFEGIHEGKIYYEYQYSIRPQEEIYDEDLNEIEGIHEESFKMGIACTDFENPDEIICESSTLSQIGLSEGKVYWCTYDDKNVPDEVSVYDIATKSTDTIQIKVDKGIPESVLSVVDGKIFLNHWEEDGFEEYDVESGNVISYDQRGYVIDEYNDYYLLGSFPYSPWAGCAVPKEDLGNEDEFIVLSN